MKASMHMHTPFHSNNNTGITIGTDEGASTHRQHAVSRAILSFMLGTGEGASTHAGAGEGASTHAGTDEGTDGSKLE